MSLERPGVHLVIFENTDILQKIHRKIKGQVESEKQTIAFFNNGYFVNCFHSGMQREQ